MVTGTLQHTFEIESIAPCPTWLVIHPDVALGPAVRFVADRIAEGFQAFARDKSG